MKLLKYKLSIVYFSEVVKDDICLENFFPSYRKAKKTFNEFEQKYKGVISHAEITPEFETEIL